MLDTRLRYVMHSPENNQNKSHVPSLYSKPSRSEIKFFSVVFWKIDDFINTFWHYLTFRTVLRAFIYFSQKFFCTMGHRNFCTEALLQKFLYPIVQKISVKSRWINLMWTRKIPFFIYSWLFFRLEWGISMSTPTLKTSTVLPSIWTSCGLLCPNKPELNTRRMIRKHPSLTLAVLVISKSSVEACCPNSQWL